MPILYTSDMSTMARHLESQFWGGSIKIELNPGTLNWMKAVVYFWDFWVLSAWLQLTFCCLWIQRTTSGIPGGYRLVSTYDLPGCKTILKFEIWSFSRCGGYSETFGFGLSDNFHFWGEGGILKLRIGYSGRIWTKISTTPAGSSITDSLSHTTYVETNKGWLSDQYQQVSIPVGCVPLTCQRYVF